MFQFSFSNWRLFDANNRCSLFPKFQFHFKFDLSLFVIIIYFFLMKAVRMRSIMTILRVPLRSIIHFFGLYKRLCVCICSDIELRFWISVGFRIWRRRFAMLTRIDPLFEQQVATGLWRQFKLYRMGIFMHFVLLWVSFGLWVLDFFCVFLLEM